VATLPLSLDDSTRSMPTMPSASAIAICGREQQVDDHGALEDARKGPVD